MKIYSYKISYNPNYDKDLNIVIPTPSIQKSLFKKAKKSIEDAAKYVQVNIILNAVIDNGPNFRFSRSVNRGLEETDADFYLNMNDDMVIDKMALFYSIQDFNEIPKLGLLGALLFYPDGKIQHAGIYPEKRDFIHFCLTFPWIKAPLYSLKICYQSFFTYRKHGIHDFLIYKTPKNILNKPGVVTGAYHMFTKEVYQKTNGYDENFIMGEEDIDFCLKVIEIGKLVRLDHRVKGIHHSHGSGVSYGYLYMATHRVYLFRKWGLDNILKIVEKNGPLGLHLDSEKL